MKQKKRLSQVFLRSYSSVAQTFENIDLKNKNILEIGAGRGIITRHLLAKAKHVTAIEIDPELCEELMHAFKDSKNLTIICGDATILPLNSPIIIGFLPYHISSTLLFRILNSKFHEAILCVQDEFARRLVAEENTKEYSKLTVMARSKADILCLQPVPKADFIPKPQVDSALIYLKKNPKFKLNEQLIGAIFQHKNQKLKNALLHSRVQLHLTKAQIKNFLLEIDATKRPRSISLKELEVLSRTYEAFFTSPPKSSS